MDNQHKKITGYRDLSQAEIDLMNRIKMKAEEVGELIEEMAGRPQLEGNSDGWPDLDRRWVSIAKTHLQQGFMAAVRAVAQPTTF